MTNTTKQLTLKNDLNFYEAIGIRLNELVDKDICELLPLISNRSKIYQANNYEISYGFGIKEYNNLTLYIKDNLYEGIIVELVKWGPGRVKEKIEKKKLQAFKDIPDTILELLEKITLEVNYSDIIDNIFADKGREKEVLAIGVSPF